ncbi:MAG: ATP-binding cassette domain-containing protein, partial [Bacteroidia bacterium]|nr:ATP-binding cassette domain-containing protein [Bacteroidia bacterium]
MQIELQKAGKKYYREWIFRGLSLTLNASGKVAVLGPNGSGKSTLLQMLSGAVV